MIAAFKLTDLQAEAILNMRLRALRRLEEFEIKGEHKKLSAERKDLKALLKDEKLQWGRIAEEVQETKAKFGQKTALGKRRTEVADAPVEIEHALEDFVEREPITIVCSEKGWIRAAKGHLWQPGAGGMAVHTILLDPKNDNRIYVAISAGEQIEAPITHRIFVRWLDYLNQSQAVVRETIRPDNTTRSPITSHVNRPPRDETWWAVRCERPSLPAQ